jgi:hypothetical protein
MINRVPGPDLSEPETIGSKEINPFPPLLRLELLKGKFCRIIRCVHDGYMAGVKDIGAGKENKEQQQD